MGANASELKLHKILNICNIDLMAYKILLPWLRRLRADCVESHLACCFGPYANLLKAEGLVLHDLPIRRTWNPLDNLRALVATMRLLRSDQFEIVVVHSAIAAAVARFACLFTGYRPVMYVMHGMYLTEGTKPLARITSNTIERILSRVTNTFQFVSQEDLVSARASGLVRSTQQAVWGCVGVAVDVYCPDAEVRSVVRERWAIPQESVVIGIVARVVREKGFVEFFEMAREIAKSDRSVRFMVVGDSLPSDRDGVSKELRQWVSRAGIEHQFLFIGHTDSVDDYLKAMDIFVLPTYREGFPVSVLEAMATGLPIVATMIRGCREAVVDGLNGLLVPPRDSSALTDAVWSLVRSPESRASMGEAGRNRVIENFEQSIMADRFVRHVLDTYFEAAGMGSSKGSALKRPA